MQLEMRFHDVRGGERIGLQGVEVGSIVGLFSRQEVTF
jgi:hypothetical protein